MQENGSIEGRMTAVLQSFIADWGRDDEIARDTSLVADLEFDSIDVIQLFVAVETAFGKGSLGFQELIMNEGRYADDLRVGEMIDFVAAKLRAEPLFAAAE